MLIGTIGCIISIALYFITIAIGFFLEKKLFDDEIGSVKSGKTAGEVANILLEKYGINSQERTDDENELEEDEEYEENEDIEDFEETSRFSFATTDEHIADEEETSVVSMPTYPNVNRVDKKIHTYGVDYDENKVFLSSDIYDSTSLDAVGIAAYQAMSLLSNYDEDKPAKYSLITIITAIPKLVLQIGWLAAILPFLGVIELSIMTVIVLNCIVIGSFLLNLLNILYPKYIAEKVVEELIEEKVIDESEVETIFETTNVLANKTATSCFGFLRWFLRKFMGYDV